MNHTIYISNNCAIRYVSWSYFVIFITYDVQSNNSDGTFDCCRCVDPSCAFHTTSASIFRLAYPAAASSARSLRGIVSSRIFTDSVDLHLHKFVYFLQLITSVPASCAAFYPSVPFYGVRGSGLFSSNAFYMSDSRLDATLKSFTKVSKRIILKFHHAS